MQLLAFRIKNFRSIVDTNWCNFSKDNVTVLVGQNESGKSSILEALHCLLGQGMVSDDDLRAAAPMPEMSIRCQIDAVEMVTALNDFAATNEILFEDTAPIELAIARLLEESKNLIEMTMTWSRAKATKKLEWQIEIDAPIGEYIDQARQQHSDVKEAAAKKWILAGVESVTSTATSEAKEEEADDDEEDEESPDEDKKQPQAFDSNDVAHALHQALPISTLFNPASGLLPNTVDIDDKYQLTGTNRAAASNYLSIAKLDIQRLLKAERRERQYLLKQATEKISRDFNQFWTQTIGRNRQLQISCEIENYGSDAGDKVGKPHLVFGISDGHSMLYPKQRSEGVRWFVSFYLQLKASEVRGHRRIFLMDEPGANLHPKAQADVLRLVNSLSSGINIVYSTHSGALLEFPKLYRVHAVQRTGEDDDSPTEVIDAHSLSAASTDTLTPLMMAMGIDLSSQNVIKKHHNVLLEEISGYYYFNAFWKLTNSKQPAHFVAATGASNIPTLASMFTGWGLKFIAVMDDDTLGRTVYKQLKQELCREDDEIATQMLWKIKDCSGIEDTFSQSDFKSFILRDSTAKITGKNSEFLKTAKRSKPVMAYQFWHEVQAEKLTAADLEKQTMSKIEEIVAAVSQRLALHTPT